MCCGGLVRRYVSVLHCTHYRIHAPSHPLSWQIFSPESPGWQLNKRNPSILNSPVARSKASETTCVHTKENKQGSNDTSQASQQTIMWRNIESCRMWELQRPTPFKPKVSDTNRTQPHTWVGNPKYKRLTLVFSRTCIQDRWHQCLPELSIQIMFTTLKRAVALGSEKLGWFYQFNWTERALCCGLRSYTCCCNTPVGTGLASLIYSRIMSFKLQYHWIENVNSMYQLR